MHSSPSSSCSARSACCSSWSCDSNLFGACELLLGDKGSRKFHISTDKNFRLCPTAMSSPVHKRHKACEKERNDTYPYHIERLASRKKNLKYHTASKIEEKDADGIFQSPASRVGKPLGNGSWLSQCFSALEAHSVPEYDAQANKYTSQTNDTCKVDAAIAGN